MKKKGGKRANPHPSDTEKKEKKIFSACSRGINPNISDKGKKRHP